MITIQSIIKSYKSLFSYWVELLITNNCTMIYSIQCITVGYLCNTCVLLIFVVCCTMLIVCCLSLYLAHCLSCFVHVCALITASCVFLCLLYIVHCSICAYDVFHMLLTVWHGSLTFVCCSLYVTLCVLLYIARCSVCVAQDRKLLGAHYMLLRFVLYIAHCYYIGSWM